jgi:hypothetical protein
LHLLEACHGLISIEIFDVADEEFCIGGGDGAVEQTLGCGYFGIGCADNAWIVKVVATHCEPCLMVFCFLWTNEGDDAAIHYFLIFWHLVLWDEKYGFCSSWHLCSNALGEPAKLICKGVDPNVFCWALD